MPRRPRAPAPPSTLPSPSPSVVWRDGVQIEGTPVWCDALRTRGMCFLSHAACRTRATHRQVLATPRTRALCEALGGAGRGAEWLVSPCGRPFSLGRVRIELFPSGHLPGAAALVLTDG